MMMVKMGRVKRSIVILMAVLLLAGVLQMNAFAASEEMGTDRIIEEGQDTEEGEEASGEENSAGEVVEMAAENEPVIGTGTELEEASSEEFKASQDELGMMALAEEACAEEACAEEPTGELMGLTTHEQEATEKFTETAAEQEAAEEFTETAAEQEAAEEFTETAAEQEAAEEFTETAAEQEAAEEFTETAAEQEAAEDFTGMEAEQKASAEALQQDEEIAADPALMEVDTGHPVIALTDVPPYEVMSPIHGQVFMEDGSEFDPADYRISIFLQVEEGWEYWVKPYYNKPYTEIEDDGSFTGKFITGGNDRWAKVLHVMLVPADYTPENFTDTKAVSLFYVKIIRTTEGDISIDPYIEPHDPPIPPAPSISALLPVAEDRIAVDIGFYTDGSSPGSPLSESLIRARLETASRFSDTVRFYGSADELYKAYEIAHDMGFSVVGTAWLSGDENADKKEMDALIEHCNNGHVQVACVGNETLLSKSLTASELIEDIEYVRSGLSDPSTIPVTTSDSVDILIENESVRNACNLIMPNCYPFWGGADISEAAGYFIDSINNLKAVSGDKQVLVSETGWPTAGNTIGSAVPGEEAAAAYFDAVRSWSLESGTQVLYFEAFDEEWKAVNEGEIGRHWGFLTGDLSIKEGYAQTEFFKNHAVIRKPVSGLSISGIKTGIYTGKACTQKIVVKDGGSTLVEGTHYTVSYKNNINPGTNTAVVVITGKGDYVGEVSKTFTISKADQKLSCSSISTIDAGRSKTFTVTGAAGKLSVKSGNTKVAATAISGSKVKVTGKSVGTVILTIRAAGNTVYNPAVITRKIKITPKATTRFVAAAASDGKGIKLSWARVAGAAQYQIYRSNKLIKTVGNVAAYTDIGANTNGAKYTFKIVARASTGVSSQSKSVVYYKVNRPAIKKLTNSAAGKMTVKWTQNTRATGYVIQYGLKKNFSGASAVKVVNKAVVSKVITKLKKGKTYYVRLRTCRKVGSKTYCSAWSAVKTVKIKK